MTLASNRAKLFPKQTLGPWPNGKYVPLLIFPLFSSLNRSGMNSSGCSQYSGSFCSPIMGIITIVPSRIMKSEFGTFHSLVHCRGVKPAVAIVRVSAGLLWYCRWGGGGTVHLSRVWHHSPSICRSENTQQTQ